MVCFILEYLLSFQIYPSFCSKIDGVHMTVINQEIENISGNIGLHIEEMCVNAGTISSNTCFLDCLLKKSRRTKIQRETPKNIPRYDTLNCPIRYIYYY